MSNSQEPTFFPNCEDFRIWLSNNHDKESEIWVGYFKKSTNIESITWPESVDQALCFGWIDGIRKRIDEQSYMIRFTPRKPTSNWSAVNIAKVAELTNEGLMQLSGIAAIEKQTQKKSEVYSYEQKQIELSPDYKKVFKANAQAWKYYIEKLAQSARKQSTWWVMSAKQEETRQRRLKILIDCSERQQKIPQLNTIRK